MSVQYHLKLAPGDVAPYVLLPGDPGRVPLVASLWDESREVASNREYVTFTGTYRGVPISCTSTGIGCPSTAIAMEELARVGATTFVRIGTCGTFQDRVRNGDMAIFDSATRYDGASRLYAPLEFPAVADHEIVDASIAAGEALGYPFHVGTTRSADTFYAMHPRPGSSFNHYWQAAWGALPASLSSRSRMNCGEITLTSGILDRAAYFFPVHSSTIRFTGPPFERSAIMSTSTRAWAR